MNANGQRSPPASPTNVTKPFEPLFGGTRSRTSGKLKEIGAVRNDVFHFKREITMQDHQTLAGHRNWLLNKIKQAEASRKRETQS